jgi:hypothetical protein
LRLDICKHSLARWCDHLPFLTMARYADIMEQLRDTVACLGSNDLDGPRAGFRDSDNLVAGGRDDLVGAAARRCWVVVAALR